MATSARAKPRSARGTARRAGREARTLGERALRRLPGPVQRFVEGVRRDDLLLFAAGLGFYALVSIAPLTILVLWIAGLVFGDARLHEFANAVGRVAPKNLGADRAVERVASLGTSLGVWAAVTALWPASAYGSGLKRAFDRLGGEREGARGLRGRGLALAVLLPLFSIGVLAAAFAGSKALGRGSVGRVVGPVIALAVGFVVAAVAIVAIYRIFPPEPLPLRAVLRGSGVAALGISVVTVALVAYAAAGTNFQEHYVTSGLALVVLLALWLFVSNVLMLVGYKAALQASGRSVRTRSG